MVKTASLYNFFKTGNDVIDDVVIWVQDGSKADQRWLRKTLHKQTDKQTDRQRDRHYENNGHLAVNQYWHIFRRRLRFSIRIHNTATKAYQPNASLFGRPVSVEVYALWKISIHRVRKKVATIFLPLTLSNADRFSKYFHLQTYQ